MQSQIGDKAAPTPVVIKTDCVALYSMETGGKQVAVGVADQNGFNNDDPARAATVFQKDLPPTPHKGEVLVRHSAPHDT